MSLVLLCPGQGSQHPRMFAKVAGVAAVRPLLQALRKLCGRDAATLAAGEDRFANAIAQPLVCAGALAHWQALREALPIPSLVVGYSVGELAAHALAGSFDAVACLSLAVARAQAMDAAAPAGSGLLAVRGLERPRLQALCVRTGADLAIANGPAQQIAGGPLPALQRLEAEVAAAGAQSTRLPVSVPAHTHWLRPAADAFARTLARRPPQVPAVAVLAGIDGLPALAPARIAASLAAQIAAPVEWQTVLQQAYERGGRVFLELGPGSALARMVRELLPGAEARSVEDFQTLEGVAEWVRSACARAG